MSGYTHTDVFAVSDDLLDCVGMDIKALDQRVSKMLDRLDAKHLDAVAHILGIAALIARRMATERGKQEDADQEREHRERETMRELGYTGPWPPVFPATQVASAPFDHPPQRRIG